MVLLVVVEVGPEVVDASREDRDLDGGAPDISFVELVLLNDLCSVDRHRCVCLRKSLRYRGSCFVLLQTAF